jgi:uncharacterized protein YkwD
MLRRLAVPIAALAVLLGGAHAAPPPPYAVPTRAAAARAAAAQKPTALEERMLEMTNQERTKRGLKPLEWDAGLCLAGRAHSREMAMLNYFDHTSPTVGAETPADRWEQIVRYPPAQYTLGENLFYGSITDTAWAHRSLMESAGHRQNILNPSYSYIGIGVYTETDGRMWVTEVFLSM